MDDLWGIFVLFCLLVAAGVVSGSLVVLFFMRQLNKAIDEIIEDGLKRMTEEE